jgi:hypothetical protein
MRVSGPKSVQTAVPGVELWQNSRQFLSVNGDLRIFQRLRRSYITKLEEKDRCV